MELSEAEEGERGGVGTKLDVETTRGFAGKGSVELLEDLTRQSIVSNGADRVAGVVR